MRRLLVWAGANSHGRRLLLSVGLATSIGVGLTGMAAAAESIVPSDGSGVLFETRTLSFSSAYTRTVDTKIMRSDLTLAPQINPGDSFVVDLTDTETTVPANPSPNCQPSVDDPPPTGLIQNSAPFARVLPGDTYWSTALPNTLLVNAVGTRDFKTTITCLPDGRTHTEQEQKLSYTVSGLETTRITGNGAGCFQPLPYNGIASIQPEFSAGTVPVLAIGDIDCTPALEQGFLKISKVFDPKTSGFSGSFAIVYNCGDGDVTVNLGAAQSTTVGPFDTGTSCTVFEPALPNAPTGWSFGTPATSGSPATIVTGGPAEAVEVTLTNTITRDTGSLKISKTVLGAPSGFSGTFSVDVACTGDGGTYSNLQIDYPTPGFVTVSRIPTGVQCTVTEDAPTVAPSGYAWGTPSVTGSPATIAKNTTTDVAVGNVVNGRAQLTKTTGGSSTSTMAWTFQLIGPNPPGMATELKSTPPNTFYFSTSLTPGALYRVCESGIPAGWTTTWRIDGALVPFIAAVASDPVPSDGYYSRIFDPNYVTPPATYANDTRCLNFKVAAGTTIAIAIDNSRPGGDPRTIGFWKNWNTCSGGNQPRTAAKNGGAGAGWYLLDDLLLNPGYTVGDLRLGAGDCLKAVDILNKSDIITHRKSASDAAYNLAAQFLAAGLNLSSGAETCSEVVSAVNNAQTLLDSINFTGTASYLTNSKQANYRMANELARTLDQYNNGFLCA